MKAQDLEVKGLRLKDEYRKAGELLKQLRGELPTLRAAIDSAPSDGKRRQRQKRYDVHRESITATQREIEDLEIAIEANEQQLTAAVRAAPALRAQRSRAEKICKELETELCPEGEKAIAAIAAWHERVMGNFQQLDEIAANKDLRWALGTHAVRQSLGELLWSRIGPLAGMNPPHRAKRPTLKQIMARGRTAVASLEEST